jgi:hypothetical protein
MTDGTNRSAQHSSFAMLVKPVLKPVFGGQRAPPESPLRAVFKADKIRVRNSFGQSACGISGICDTKATSADAAKAWS